MNAVLKRQRVAGHPATQVAQRVLEKCEELKHTSVTPMQLLKLVYLCHGWMLGIHGRPLIDEPIEAWTYGPVIPSLYHKIKGYKSSPVSRVVEERTVDFDEQEEDIIAQVCDIYGGMTGIQLSSLTHRPGSPWEVTWRTIGKSADISNDLIEEHYRTLAEVA